MINLMLSILIIFALIPSIWMFYMGFWILGIISTLVSIPAVLVLLLLISVD